MATVRRNDTGEKIELLKSRTVGAGGSIYEYGATFLAKELHTWNEDKQHLDEKLDILRDRLEGVAQYEDGSWRLSLPLCTLSDLDGELWGYLMPRLSKGASWFQAFKVYPSLNIRVVGCATLAESFGLLHQKSIWIGDMNPNNFRMFPDGRSSLIDVDSFHIGGRHGLASAFGFPAFSAPECWKKDWHSNHLSCYQDRWGLAALIYKLLVGEHPFYADSGFANEDDCVAVGIESETMHFLPRLDMREHRVFGIENMKLPYWYLPESLCVLFERTFIDGFHKPELRPAPEEWSECLRNLELSQCSQGHYFFKESGACTDCNRFTLDG